MNMNWQPTSMIPDRQPETTRIFTMTYRICERADATNCAQGTATIELSGK